MQSGVRCAKTYSNKLQHPQEPTFWWTGRGEGGVHVVDFGVEFGILNVGGRVGYLCMTMRIILSISRIRRRILGYTVGKF